MVAQAYYADGRRQSVQETRGGQTNTFTWRYDDLGRLIEEQRNAPGSTDDYIDAFVYDLVGNRLRHVRSAAAGVTDTRYSYNVMDQLLTQTAGAATTGFGYDAYGRMTSRTPSSGPALSYTYTADDRLAAVVQGGSTLVSYTYDPDGFRVTRTVPGASTQDRKYLVDPVNPTGYAQVVAELREISGSDVLQRSYLIGHRVLAQISGGGTAHPLLADGRGSTRGLATESATIAEAYDYDAYGNTLDTGTMAGAAGTPLLYNGEWHDANANMQYLRARWYDSGVGRFNRIDPFAGVLGNPLTLHKYGYAHGDPVNGSDPSGLFTLREVTAGIAVTSVLSGIINSAVGYARGGIRGAVAGFVAGSFGTAAALFGIVSIGLYLPALLPVAVQVSFAFGAALTAFIEILLTRGAGALSDPGTWIVIGAAAIVGFILGVFDRGQSLAIARGLTAKLAKLPGLRQRLEQLAAGWGPAMRADVEMARRLLAVPGKLIVVVGKWLRPDVFAAFTGQTVDAGFVAAFVPMAVAVGSAFEELWKNEQ